MPDSLGHETLETVGTCYTPLANNGWYANSEGPKAEFYYVQGPGQIPHYVQSLCHILWREIEKSRIWYYTMYQAIGKTPK